MACSGESGSDMESTGDDAGRVGRRLRLQSHRLEQLSPRLVIHALRGGLAHGVVLVGFESVPRLAERERPEAGAEQLRAQLRVAA